MWSPRHKTNDRATARQVVTDAERLLAGQVLSTDDRRSQHIRPWMILNALAHSDQTTLRHTRDQPNATHPNSSSAAVAYLAAEVLATVANDEDLARIQRDVLIPLELHFLTAETFPPPTPAGLAEAVIGALDQHPPRRDR